MATLAELNKIKAQNSGSLKELNKIREQNKSVSVPAAFKPSSQQEISSPIATPQFKPVGSVMQLPTVQNMFSGYEQYKQNSPSFYTDEMGNRKALQNFSNATIGAAPVNSYENFVNERGFNSGKLPTDEESQRFNTEFNSYLMSLPLDQQQKLMSDKENYDARIQREFAVQQAKNPGIVGFNAAINSATLGLSNLQRQSQLAQEYESGDPLKALMTQDALEEGRAMNPKAEIIGSVAGSVLPYGAASKALSPVTKPIVQKLGGGILGNVVEGAISGAVPDAIQSVVQNKGDISNVPKDVLRGAVEGAVFDVGGGILGKSLSGKTGISDAAKNKQIDKVMKAYDEKKSILPGESQPGQFYPKPIQAKKTITQQFQEAQKKELPKTGNDLLDRTRQKLGITPTTGNSLIDSVRQKSGITTGNLNTNKTPVKIIEPKKELPAQNDKLKKLEDDYKNRVNNIKNNKQLNNKEKSKRLKALGMKHSANKRELIQGDSFEKVEGGLTEKELKAKIQKEKSNYIGKKVIVDGKNAVVTGNPYGKVSVKFEDGTIKSVTKDKVKPLKYNPDFETKIKSAKPDTEIGTLGDYIQGEQTRELYKPVLDTPIKVTDSKNIVNGAMGEVNGKPTILINKNTANVEDTILEEASHAMRETKGRSNLGLSGIDEAKRGAYESLPYEKSAGKMVEYAKTLDNPKIEGMSGQKKNLKLIESVKSSDQYSKKIKTNVKGDYEVKGNDQLIRDADALIRTDPERAMRLAKSEDINSDMSNEVARQLVQKAQKDKRWDDAIELIETTAKKAKDSGRAVQALSLWSKLTPEGMLKYAQNMIDKANAKFAKMNPKEFEKIKAEYKKKHDIDIKYYSLSPRQSQMAKIIRLTADDAKYINDQMVKIGKMADGRSKVIEVAKTLDYIAAKIPPSMLQKISTLQTIAQLLNAKTALRNTLGNGGFMTLEMLSDAIGTPIDKLVSVATGERTKFLPDIKTQAKGLKSGFDLGLEDALLGIDTSGLGTQLDLPNRTFRSGFFGLLEKAMNIELRATDRAFYQAAFDQSLRNQMKAKKIFKIADATNEMIEQAHLDGLYKTFQDKNFLSDMFSKLKRDLNGNKEFGFGDFILKYPKTPANLLMRGIDYSPLGIVKELFNIGRKGFDQKRFVESLSRGAVGTGLMGGAVLLYNLGIIQGKKPKDKEAAELMKEAGQGQYTINLSALKRFMMSGLNPDYAKIQDGDAMINYDWVQPGALPITVGANIAEQKKDNKVSPGDLIGATVYSLSAGIETLAEQPLIQNFAKLFRGYSLLESGQNVLKDTPASFVPTFVNQARQLVDNASRDTQSDKAYGAKEAFNRVLYKIPGLSKTLPERVTTTGKTKEVYQGGNNNWFNVFFNPAFASNYNATPGMKLVLDLYKDTGETKQFPREVDNKITYKNKTITLTKEQQNELQRLTGSEVVKKLDTLASSPGFNMLSKEKKIQKIKSILDSVGDKQKNKTRKQLTTK